MTLGEEGTASRLRALWPWGSKCFRPWFLRQATTPQREAQHRRQEDQVENGKGRENQLQEHGLNRLPPVSEQMGEGGPIGSKTMGIIIQMGRRHIRSKTRKRRRSNSSMSCVWISRYPKKQFPLTVKGTLMGGGDELPYIPRSRVMIMNSRTLAVKSYARSDDWRLSLFEISPKVAAEDVKEGDLHQAPSPLMAICPSSEVWCVGWGQSRAEQSTRID